MLHYFLCHFGVWGTYLLSVICAKGTPKLSDLPRIIFFSAIGTGFSLLAHWHFKQIGL